MKDYDPREIEPKWQKFWEERGLFKAPRKPSPERKYYVLEMFPYPSGRDLHMGHLKNYAIGDAVARLAWMEGKEVLHPMGWDAFGLPAENAAIKHGVDPERWTRENIEGYKENLRLLGISYDWDRELATCDPDYYKWTQWLFLLMYERGLAYRAEGYVNWCPGCNTVLANEQVVGGRCERCGSVVIKRKLTQWFFRITQYAERLLGDLDKLRGRWPDRIIKQQEDWIGKSQGVEIVFPVEGMDLQIPVFTTRADTLFGVTFLTVAPEWPRLQELLEGSPKRDEVMEYVKKALLMSELERTSAQRPKTGVFTGRYALHPMTGERVPIYVGDYVIGTYGTGAVMGVPAHDQRDFEFAKAHGLPIKVVIKPGDGPEPNPDDMEGAYEEPGVMVNSGEFSGLTTQEGIRAIGERLREMGLGGPKTSYRLRDWLISRQRYWGAPIPVVHCERCGVVPVPKEELPVLLPKIDDYIPKGRSPLENSREFMETRCPRCGGPARRDPDTMDTFVDSSWYFLRFIDPKNDEEPFSSELANAWMPVDQYIGGAEHATKHLIYARFVAKVLFDAGYIKDDEPFARLFTQGLVLKRFKYCEDCQRVVPEGQEGEHRGHRVTERLEMMSKSRGNIVPVGPFVREHGADIARITILFAGPPEKDMEWTDAGVEGARRFLRRLWRLYQENPRKSWELEPEALAGEERELYIFLQRTIKAVRDDLSEFGFNTALARMMELLNRLYSFGNKASPVFHRALRELILLLAPFAPHIAEELWHTWAGGEDSVFRERYPEPDQRFLEFDTIELPVQVNGRLRARLRVRRGLTEEEALRLALAEPRVAKHTQGKNIKRVIYIKDRLLNIVVG